MDGRAWCFGEGVSSRMAFWETCPRSDGWHREIVIRAKNKAGKKHTITSWKIYLSKIKIFRVGLFWQNTMNAQLFSILTHQPVISSHCSCTDYKCSVRQNFLGNKLFLFAFVQSSVWACQDKFVLLSKKWMWNTTLLSLPPSHFVTWLNIENLALKLVP